MFFFVLFFVLFQIPFWTFFFFSFFFNLFFKIAISWRAGVGRHPRFIFWLTFFVSYMLSLFFSELLSFVRDEEEEQQVFHVQERQLSLSSFIKKTVSSILLPSIMQSDVFLVCI